MLMGDEIRSCSAVMFSFDIYAFRPTPMDCGQYEAGWG
jgi:hypothetical protein